VVSVLDIIFKTAGWVVAGIVGLFVLRWGYTEYCVATHCTTVLGTRVCR